MLRAICFRLLLCSNANHNIYEDSKQVCLCIGDWQKELNEALEQLSELLCGDELLSAYELQSSGLATALLQVLSHQTNGKN